MIAEDVYRPSALSVVGSVVDENYSDVPTSHCPPSFRERLDGVILSLDHFTLCACARSVFTYSVTSLLPVIIFVAMRHVSSACGGNGSSYCSCSRAVARR